MRWARRVRKEEWQAGKNGRSYSIKKKVDKREYFNIKDKVRKILIKKKIGVI